MKGELEKLKSTQQRLGSAMACKFKESGEVIIYITSDADNDEVMKSLIQLSTEISKHRGVR